MAEQSEEPACNAGDLQEMQAQSLGGKDPLEKRMATHSSSLVLENPREPGGLQSMESQSRTQLSNSATPPSTYIHCL